MQETYYSTSEVAERYNVTTRTVLNWIDAGDLTAERRGVRSKSHWRISESALAEFDQKRLAASQPKS